MDDNIKKFVNISLWVVAILLVLRNRILLYLSGIYRRSNRGNSHYNVRF